MQLRLRSAAKHCFELHVFFVFFQMVVKKRGEVNGAAGYVLERWGEGGTIHIYMRTACDGFISV